MEQESHQVKKKAVKGVLVLTLRTFVLNAIALAAQGFLWAFLTPGEFGTFFIVSAIVSFLTYFSDIGLAAALIQKREEPTEEDYRTTFTIQQSLILILLIILIASSPVLKNIYHLTPESQLLLYALGASFLMSSLKSIPSVMLERKLEFGKFIIPQVLENMVYNLALVFFAWKGMGITSFTYAVLIRGVVGLVTIYLIQPWQPRLALSKKSLKELLHFGVPYQLNTFLAVLKDDGVTILLGGLLGSVGMGILGTARRLSQYPLRFFMDNVIKVTFPAFARLQDDRDNLTKSVEKSLFFITFLVFPSVAGLVLLAPVLVKVIPRYDRWTPALIPLAIVSVDALFASFTTQITNLLNAIGRIKTTFRLMIMWTVLTLTLVPVLAWKFGVNGASAGYALVGISSIVAVVIIKKIIPFSLIESIGKTGIATGVMVAVILLTRNYFQTDLKSLGILTLIGAAAYIVSLISLVGYSVLLDAKKAILAIFSH